MEKTIIINCTPFSNPIVFIKMVGKDECISTTVSNKQLYSFIAEHMDHVSEIKIKGMKIYTKKIEKELREYLISTSRYNSVSITLI